MTSSKNVHKDLASRRPLIVINLVINVVNHCDSAYMCKLIYVYIHTHKLHVDIYLYIPTHIYNYTSHIHIKT